MRRSMLLAGVAGLAVAAFAGSALAQNSWGTKETTYFNSPATNPDFGRTDRPQLPTVAAPMQPGDDMQAPGADMNTRGSAPGIPHGRVSEPTLDSTN